MLDNVVGFFQFVDRINLLVIIAILYFWLDLFLSVVVISRMDAVAKAHGFALSVVEFVLLISLTVFIMRHLG